MWSSQSASAETRAFSSDGKASTSAPVLSSPVIKDSITDDMKLAGISGISTASFSSDGKISPIQQGVIGKDSAIPVTSETLFGAASLSKPVFAYLVQKLIADNKANEAKSGVGKFTLAEGLTYFDLDTPLYKILPEILERFSGEHVAKARDLTARHVLSHQTGLPIKQGEGPLKFQFEPGKGYGYSNPAFALLQEVIDKLTGSNLETLAQANLKHLGRFTFLDEKGQMHAANSLSVTATGLARFFRHWMLHGPQEAFESQISLVDDKWALGQGLSKDDLGRIDWGIGLGLEKTSAGKVVRAFHSGDMNQWRAFVAIDLENKTGIVYLANSTAGFLLLDKIISPVVGLEHGLKYLFQKFGFARTLEPGWKEAEIKRITKIIATYERLPVPIPVVASPIPSSQPGTGSSASHVIGLAASAIAVGIVTMGVFGSRSKQTAVAKAESLETKKDSIKQDASCTPCSTQPKPMHRTIIDAPTSPIRSRL
ncbi:hypothetical protein BH10PSE19_BH10PSE19_13470 [soil metagenome]